MWYTWQWHSFEEGNNAFADQRPEPNVVQTEESLHRPFVLTW